MSSGNRFDECLDHAAHTRRHPAREDDEGTFAFGDEPFPLARERLRFRAAGHWAAHGYEDRIVYEPLHATDRTLAWSMLPKSAAPTTPPANG